MFMYAGLYPNKYLLNQQDNKVTKTNILTIDKIANPLPIFNNNGTTLNFPALPWRVSINFIPYALNKVLVSFPLASL